MKWINPIFLDTQTQKKIRNKFIRDSQVELCQFLNV